MRPAVRAACACRHGCTADTSDASTPQTNGMVERFNGRIASEVLGINVAGHADLEILLTGFNRAYNRRRQRVLQGASPSQKVDERIQRKPALANPLYKPAAQDDLMAKVDDVLYYANDVSQPDSSPDRIRIVRCLDHIKMIIA
nr:integrase core domain-containing protein [Sphingobium xenophagum]